MPGKKNPFFDLADFQALEFFLSGENLTSRVALPVPGIALVEILEDGVWLQTPPRTCSIGHTLALDIGARKLIAVTAGRQEYLEFKNHITGVVQEIEGNPKEIQLARLAFRQFSKDRWHELLNYFSSRHGTINLLIKNTRK
jgi:hypothetical protein